MQPNYIKRVINPITLKNNFRAYNHLGLSLGRRRTKRAARARLQSPVKTGRLGQPITL